MAGPEVQEICRSCQEFYPDRETRHRANYLFAHRFLPEYFFRNPRGVVGGVYLVKDADCVRYIQARWQMMEHLAGFVKEPERRARPLTLRRVTDLAAWKQTISGHPALCVEMPEPEESPGAFFVSLILLVDAGVSFEEWPVNASGRVFTLERLPDGRTDHGVLCEWTQDAHHNHGILVSATRFSFCAAVENALKDS